MINLYSDTQTVPTENMRKAIANAEVGDEHSRSDPTTLSLEKKVAELLGKEEAVFLPSGTMCNLIGVAINTSPGDVIMLESNGHILRSETGGPAIVSNVLTDPIEGERGQFTTSQIEQRLDQVSRYRPPTSLICLEQTHNFAGGTVWPLELWEEVCSFAKSRELRIHVDGARLLNAVVASGVDAKIWARQVDTIWIDFSKGLGAPMGACIAGSAELIDKAWLWKHRLGGAMRQSGLMAAAAIFALDENIERLGEDHKRAKRLAGALKELGAEVIEPETNIVFFDMTPCGKNNYEVVQKLSEKDVQMSEIGNQIRAVTHLDIDDADIESAINAINQIVNG
jgi:threonine aldolase